MIGFLLRNTWAHSALLRFISPIINRYPKLMEVVAIHNLVNTMNLASMIRRAVKLEMPDEYVACISRRYGVDVRKLSAIIY